MPRPAWLSLSTRNPPVAPGEPRGEDARGGGGSVPPVVDRFQRSWLWLVLILWLGTAVFLIWNRWGVFGQHGIQGFGLGDTDDNLRMMQVRAWILGGQDWYDLRQYRLGGPGGLNVHWSRIVDLPIAGIYLALKPFIGGAAAERWAVAVAPLLPLLPAMVALALTARRLLSPFAFWLPPILLLCGGSLLAQFVPLRIDHHGWQLALLATVVAGIADPRRARGGLTMGIASGLSLAIGLEMLLYLALAGVAAGLFWVRNAAEGRRLAAYGVSFAATAALGFLLFASKDNWLGTCDALSPVWLSVVLLAGAVALALHWLSPASVWARLSLALAGGALVAAMYALSWPDCLGRLERVPDELNRLWLSHVREAMPLWKHGTGLIVAILTLPAIGLVGYLVMLWRSRRAPEVLQRWAAIAAMAALAAGLLAWQTRAASAAQLLAVPGAAALGWVLIAWFAGQRWMLVRVFGIGASVMLVTGGIVTQASGWWDDKGPPTPAQRAINNANWRCPQPWALHGPAQQPRGLVLTFVDLGPRLVTLTHHDAIAGPYHRNAQAILDVMRAFRGDAANARAIIERRGVDYVLICPNMSESTIYRAEAGKGFYGQLTEGKAPDWLEPVELPKNSPFRMWRVRR